MPTIREVLTLEDKFSQAFGKYITLAEQAASSTKEVQSAASQAQIASNSLSSTFNSASTQCSKMATETEELARAAQNQANQARNSANSTKQMGNSFSTATNNANNLVTQIAAIVVAIKSLKEVLNLSDELAGTNARLEIMLDNLNDTSMSVEQLSQSIYDMSVRSRSLYTETSSFVSRLGTLAGDAFGSAQEVVLFAEQLNKHMRISKTSAAEASGAMTQLTQALASGTLRGDELNSVMEQIPSIANAISEYMGISKGEIKDLAAEGQITSDVVKNSLFYAAKETNEEFEKLPLTWNELASVIANSATRVASPALDWLATIPQTIADNWSAAEPVIVASLAAVGTAFLLLAGKQLVALATNPVFWIIVAISSLIGIIYLATDAYNQHEGTAVSALGLISGTFAITGANAINWLRAIGIFIANTINYTTGMISAFANFFANFLNDPAAAVVGVIADMVLTALGFINNMAKAIDMIFGSNLSGIVSSWMSELQSQADEAIKIAGNGSYQKRIEPIDAVAEVNKFFTDLGFPENGFKLNEWGQNGYDIGADISKNFQSIGDDLSEALGGVADDISENLAEAFQGLNPEVEDIGSDVSAIKKSVAMSEEDIKSLVDMAERRYVNNINLTSQSPVIQIQGQNTGNTATDRKALADAIAKVLLEQSAAASVKSTVFVT